MSTSSRGEKRHAESENPDANKRRKYRRKVKEELQETLKSDILKIKERRNKKKSIEKMISWSSHNNNTATMTNKTKTKKDETKPEIDKKKRVRNAVKQKAEKLSKNKINQTFDEATKVGDMSFDKYIDITRRTKHVDVYESEMKYMATDYSLDKRKSIDSFITKFYPSTNTTTPIVSTNVIKSMNTSIEKKKAAPKISKKKEEAISSEEFINKNDLLSIEHGLKPSQYGILMKIIEKEQENETSYVQVGRNYLKRKEFVAPVLEECSVQFCSDFLREPSPISNIERPCRNGDECMCMLMALQAPDTAEDVSPEDAFICREFLIPSVRDKVLATGELPDIVEMCLVCIRFKTTFRYYKCIYDSYEPRELLQNHCNTVNTAGGYILDQCIYPNPKTNKRFGIDRPIVAFKATNYIYATKEDPHDPVYTLKYLVETNLDF